MLTRARIDPWLLTAVGSAAAFAVVAAVIVLAGALPFDAALVRVIRGIPVAPWAWATVTELGNLALILIGAATAVAALATGRLRLAVIIAVTLIAAAMATGAAKLVFDRPRPPDPLALATGWSFPSGHALNSSTTYGVLALLAWRSDRSAEVRRLAVGLALGLILVIGLSRVGLGLHWPSDVLAGWLVGLVFVSSAAIAIERWSAMEPDVVLRWPAWAPIRNRRPPDD